VVTVAYSSLEEILAILDRVPGSLTASLHLGASDPLAELLTERVSAMAGRVVFNGYPTGVAVSWAMQHGGPYPSSTVAATTSVGAAAIGRFVRPVTYQDAPETVLPEALRDRPDRRFPRRVDGQWQT
jgi:NADP-dependent aldehyde dehydrogenase